jgi:hypothetical protein
MSKRPLLWFLAASALLSLFVFRDALWGQSLLAPLDIAPALFSKYRWMDPQSTAIPANHHAIDQLTYDLPLQHTIYHAIRRGEIPWWDPYTFCGRPLLADAHINGTDPIRLLLYVSLPFPLAYNWTRILHFFFGALGMFLLLRHLQFRPWNCVLWALTYQFAGTHTIAFPHPWIQASFVYYPYLWLAWDRAFTNPKPLNIISASLLIAALFYTGNLQSHSYVIVFAVAILIGYGWKSPGLWKRGLFIVATTGVVGAMLAAPVLGNQIELFIIAQRNAHIQPLWVRLLNFPGALASAYPWLMGTHRTIDLSKLTGQHTLAFKTFIGSAAFVLGLLGAFLGYADDPRRPARRAAIALVCAYVFIIVTPLVSYLYTRCATLAVMGLALLGASAIERLVAAPQRKRRSAWIIGGLTIAMVIALHVVAWIIYPKNLPRFSRAFEARAARSASFGEAPALRRFQVQNLPREISFQNPETVLAFLSLIVLAGVLATPNVQRRADVWTALLVLNALPVVMFSERFIPRHSVVLWERFLLGGAEQQRVAALLANQPFRLEERAVPNDMLMGSTINHLHKVRTVHGYAALAPSNPAYLPQSQLAGIEKHVADFTYESPVYGLERGILRTNHPGLLARFEWRRPTDRRFSIIQETFNSIRLRLEPGPAAELIWADTRYPGWKASAGPQALAITQMDPCFSVIKVPESALEIVLKYRPTYLKFGLVLAMASVVLAIFAMVLLRSPTQQTIAEEPQLR